MPGITVNGAQRSLNSLTGSVVPIVSGTAPASPQPGQYWINSSAGNSVNEFNGTAWVTAPVDYYLALLTADPTGQTTIAGLTEVTTTGYTRLACNFGPASATVPSVISNLSLLTFGPMTVNMTTPAQWAALVTVLSGTAGKLQYTWILDTPQQVLATQTISIAAGQLSITQS